MMILDSGLLFGATL